MSHVLVADSSRGHVGTESVLAKTQLLALQHCSIMVEGAPGRKWWGMQRGQQAEIEAGRGVRVQEGCRGAEEGWEKS